jgi:hypothetical protein
MQTTHGKKAFGSKQASFKRTETTLICQTTGHLSWTPSEITCRNEEQHENVEGTGNICFSSSSDSNHLSQNQSVRKWKGKVKLSRCRHVGSTGERRIADTHF